MNMAWFALWYSYRGLQLAVNVSFISQAALRVGCFTLSFAYLHPPIMHEVAPLCGNKMQILSESEFHALNACPHAPHDRNLKSDKPESCRGSMVKVNQGP